MADRTERIQKELDAAAADKAAASTEAAQIRQAKGDIAAERSRLIGEAEAQAAAVLEDGRARLRARGRGPRGQGRLPRSPPPVRGWATS